jgi:tripartite-type tricarboxylate transporter receptor subunit TctC
VSADTDMRPAAIARLLHSESIEVSQLGAEPNEAAARPDVSAKLLQLGLEPLRIGPAEGAVLMRNTSDQWSPVIKRLGLKLN